MCSHIISATPYVMRIAWMWKSTTWKRPLDIMVLQPWGHACSSSKTKVSNKEGTSSSDNTIQSSCLQQNEQASLQTQDTSHTYAPTCERQLVSKCCRDIAFYVSVARYILNSWAEASRAGVKTEIYAWPSRRSHQWMNIHFKWGVTSTSATPPHQTKHQDIWAIWKRRLSRSGFTKKSSTGTGDPISVSPGTH